MSNATNQIERNIAKNNIIKDIKNLYRQKKKNYIDDDPECKGLRDIRYLYRPKSTMTRIKRHKNVI